MRPGCKWDHSLSMFPGGWGDRQARPSALPPFISQLYNAMCLPTVSCYSLLPHFSHSSEHPSAGECGGLVPLTPRLWLLAVGNRLHHTGMDLRVI